MLPVLIKFKFKFKSSFRSTFDRARLIVYCFYLATSSKTTVPRST